MKYKAYYWTASCCWQGFCQSWESSQHKLRNKCNLNFEKSCLKMKNFKTKKLLLSISFIFLIGKAYHEPLFPTLNKYGTANGGTGVSGTSFENSKFRFLKIVKWIGGSFQQYQMYTNDVALTFRYLSGVLKKRQGVKSLKDSLGLWFIFVVG